MSRMLCDTSAADAALGLTDDEDEDEEAGGGPEVANDDDVEGIFVEANRPSRLDSSKSN